MKHFSYNSLLHEERAGSRFDAISAQRNFAIDEVYNGSTGAQYVCADGSDRYYHEIVRLSRDAILLVTDSFENEEHKRELLVTDGDWVHFQFRLDGAGQEQFVGIEALEVPERVCMVSRYPENARIERCTYGADRWRYACLLMSPTGFTDLLDASVADLPDDIRWLGFESAEDGRAAAVTLSPRMISAVRDICACRDDSISRRAFMKAKSIELLSGVIRGFAESVPGAPPLKLTDIDLRNLSCARDLILQEMSGSWTLADLARRVGLNRSKLADGFKQRYGVSVRKFWRDANLEEARRRLEKGNASVTELAYDMGYSDPSSFSRAFVQKFGVSPRTFKE